MLQEYKLFVGNLPADISEEDMRTVFSTYGMVTDVHIMTGRSQSGAACAFVHYADQMSADQAIAALNKTYKIRIDAVDPITVAYARTESARQNGAGRGGNGGIGGQFGGRQANYPGFIPQPGGFPAALYPPMSPYDAPNPYAYAMAQQALAGAQGGGAGGDFLNPLYNSIHQQQHLAAVAAAAAQKGGMRPQKGAPMGGKGAGQRPGRNPHPNHPGKIFVGNLPTDITKDVLRQVFSTYGVVTDVHVMVGKSDSGQACAFVEYQQQIEAQTAINTLNNNYEIREGCGKIVCRFYEKPDGYQSQIGRGGPGGPGDRQGSGAAAGGGKGGQMAGGKNGGKYGKKYGGSAGQTTDYGYNKREHAAFLSAGSPTKQSSHDGAASNVLSTPQNGTQPVKGETGDSGVFLGRAPVNSPKATATKSTTGSPGEEGTIAGESPSHVAVA
mmetsp:Transcript_3185/g.7487  ORF Transcript_3185/g.7487 Transcript_3185/m.7487 type:complete len:441 (-) Transcript_3185:51-1373(-)|eukprot:CAMPEP_0178998636 /NCGR_PEP_ID=MMETSP0795-20121207/9618_1 /TAXON_ID=88552 /ORGANISM="Amoebophrya sp., Strain Ameob2" /LENGTH=440 /DNA_ID=CAMNT_0020691327 /DNA_START=171 /DNA_END=1493 /DNA_ORIENTATION=-